MPELHQNSHPDAGGAERRASLLTSRLAVGFIVVGGLTLVVLAFRMVRHYEHEGRRDHFNAIAQGPIQDIRRRAGTDLELLQSLAQFHTASPSVTPSAFRAFAAGPLQRYPEVECFDWIPRIPADIQADFEARIGSPLFDLDSNGQRARSTPAREYFPVELSQPDRPFWRGMNLSSDPIARVAMTNAAQLGRPVITAARPREDGTGLICLAFMPVYTVGEPPDTPAERASALRGFVGATINPARLVQEALFPDGPRWFELRLLDQMAQPETQVLYAQAPGLTGQLPPWEENGPGAIQATAHFSLGERPWAVLCRPTTALPFQPGWEPWTVLIGGGLVVLLLGAYLYQVLTRTQQVERTVAIRTRELAHANFQLHAEVAERKKTETAISRSEARLQAILDNSAAVIYLKDVEGRYLLVNREFERLFKVRREGVAGRTDFDLFPEEMAAAFQANDKRALAEGAPLEFEEVAPVDGQRHTYISIKFPLKEPQGTVQGVCGISTDITERVRAEQALKDGEALYHSLVECLPLNVVRKDRHGRVTFGNERFCQTLGRPLDQLVGKADFDLFPQKLAEKYVADDRRVIETGEVFEDIEEHHTPDGDDLYMHVLKSPVYDAKDQIVGIQVIFWDVTDKHRAQKALQRTMADLSRSNQELEQFAYVASHDLQEPLRMIASYTQLLARRYKDKLDREAEEFIGFAVDGAVRLQKLINDLLSYSRVGTRGKAFSETDCEHILQTVLMNLKIAIEESCAEITRDALPTVMGDGTQLTQLFQNLIGNALKFCGDQPPRVHVSAERDRAEWIFKVRDHGIGIDAQYFERIFVIFQRLHTQQEYPGTGIGLALCKKIIERHGGRMWVESKPGQGATFFFTLPAMPALTQNQTQP